jgi:hypothetical protein
MRSWATQASDVCADELEHGGARRACAPRVRSGQRDQARPLLQRAGAQWSEDARVDSLGAYFDLKLYEPASLVAPLALRSAPPAFLTLRIVSGLVSVPATQA